MKFSHICILALLCFATINAASESTTSAERSGSASDDWNEKTDVHNIHKSYESTHSFSKSNSWKNATGKYVAQAGDAVHEWTVTDGEETKTSTTTLAPVTTIVNGSVVTTYEKILHKVDKHRRMMTVKRFWSEVRDVESVTIIIAAFAKLVKPLTDAEYALFNTMATTDTNRLWSEYNYWEIRDTDLKVAIAKITGVFKTKITAADIAAAAQAILTCKFGYVANVIDSTSIDINNKNGWTIYAEFYAATCSNKAGATKNQLFAWAASKQGEWLPGSYSAANAATLSNLIKRWLFTHVGMLISCKDSPVKRMDIWKHQGGSASKTATKSASHSKSK